MSSAEPPAIVDELYLAVYARLPTEEERSLLVAEFAETDHRATQADRGYDVVHVELARILVKD